MPYFPLSDIEIARQSARGSLVLFIGNLVSAGIQAVAVFTIARLLGPAGYGSYTLALLIPGIFQIITGFGVIQAITRYSAYHISRGELSIAKRITKNAIIFLLLIGALFAAANYLASAYLAQNLLGRPELTPLMQLSSIFVIGQTLLQTAIAAFVGWNSMGLASASSVLQAVLKLAACTGLILLGLGVYGAVLGQISSFVLSGLIAIVAILILRLRVSGGKEERGSFLSDIKQLISYGLPIFIGTAISGLATQYVTIILAVIASNSFVGYYQAALNLTVIITITSTAVGMSLFRTFSHLSGQEGNTSLAFTLAVKYITFTVTPVIMLLIATAAPLMAIFYTSSYSTGIGYLRLLAVSNLPLGIGASVVVSFFSGIGKTRFTMIFYFSGSAVLVLFSLLLTKVVTLGIDGLIYASIIAAFVSAFFGLYLSARYLNARIEVRSTVALVLAAFLGYVVVYFVPPIFHSLVTFALDGGIYFAVYLTAVPLLHALNLEDAARLRGAAEGLGVIGMVIKPLLQYEELLLRRIHPK